MILVGELPVNLARKRRVRAETQVSLHINCTAIRGPLEISRRIRIEPKAIYPDLVIVEFLVLLTAHDCRKPQRQKTGGNDQACEEVLTTIDVLTRRCL